MPARLAAALGLACLLVAGSALARPVLTEIVGQNTLAIQTDDTTHQGTLLVNGQPVIQNPNGSVGIDGLLKGKEWNEYPRAKRQLAQSTA